MQHENIPAALKELRQWVVWRSIDLGDGRKQKLPYNAYASHVPAKATDSSTWSDFDQALHTCQRDSRFGLGFVFAEGGRFSGVDFDDAARVAPEFAEKRQQIVERIISGTTSYMELSPSGKGHHIICEGRLPTSAHVIRALQIEMYTEKRFFTMTGSVIGDRREIVNEQAMLDGFVDAFPKTDRSEYEEYELGVVITNGRRTDLTDEEVVQIAWARPGFAERYNGGHRDWSYEHKNLIGDLDKVSGDPEQVRRIAQSSPLVLNTPPKGGITRLQKSQRLFYELLGECRDNFDSGATRAWYTMSPSFVEDGKRIWLAILQAREDEAKAVAERVILEHEDVSANSRRLLDRYRQLRETDKALTYPPGAMGEIVRGIEAIMDTHFTKFVIPGAFALVSGIAGRRYKLSSGGLNLFFVLGAPPASGKSQVVTACARLADALSAAVAGNRMGEHHSRVLAVSTSSIQAIHKYFMQTPSLAWFVDECKTLLDKMSNKEASSVDSALRDGFNRLYDSSKLGTSYIPPVSMNAEKMKLEAVPNLNVSTFWTTTTDNVKLADKDVTDGFLSRVIVVRHGKRAGEPKRSWEVEQMPPDPVMGRLFQISQMASEMDEGYLLKRLVDVVHVSTDAVDELAWALRMTGEDIKNEALEGRWPSEYHMVSRIHMNAMRMAATMAVAENPFLPIVTEDQLLWSYGYILQNTAALLSDMEQGEIGVTMSKDVEVVVREMKKIMRKEKVHGVKRGEFAHRLKQLKPFVDATPSPGEAVKRTLIDMIANDMLAEAIENVGQRGRPAKLLMPTESSVWAK